MRNHVACQLLLRHKAFATNLTFVFDEPNVVIVKVCLDSTFSVVAIQAQSADIGPGAEVRGDVRRDVGSQSGPRGVN